MWEIMRESKQVIVMRKDLKMRRGKEIAQGAHASMAFFLAGFRISEADEAIQNWIKNSNSKICLQVNSEQELLDIETQAMASGVECHIITDLGKTEFDGVATKTCLALGPDWSDKIDPITSSLRLY
jgi:PTH2 family peptidyl-tRNA hydrolase